MTLAFVDTETTGLDPDRHEVWEIALIVDGAEYEWQLPVDLAFADPGALRVGRFYERRQTGFTFTPPEEVADKVAHLTANRHLIGAVPSFDAAFLSRFLARQGRREAWHYHLIDVEALAAGFLATSDRYKDQNTAHPPWDSDQLSAAIGIDPSRFDRHTALGDARWAKAVYETVMGTRV